MSPSFTTVSGSANVYESLCGLIATTVTPYFARNFASARDLPQASRGTTVRDIANSPNSM